MTQRHETLDEKTTEYINAISQGVLEALLESIPDHKEYTKINLCVNVLSVCLVKVGHNFLDQEFRKNFAEGIYQNLLLNFQNLEKQ